MTNKHIIQIAKKLKFKICKNVYSHGELVFTNNKCFISYDNTSHNGGFWKMARSIKNLSRKNTRGGTYNKDLTKRIND